MMPGARYFLFIMRRYALLCVLNRRSSERGIGLVVR